MCMDDRLALAGLTAVCALLSFCLPEREPTRALCRSLALLDGLGAERWAAAYLGWELALLTEMGFGLT
jgi:DNA repair protein RecO (recombination protein O)